MPMLNFALMVCIFFGTPRVSSDPPVRKGEDVAIPYFGVVTAVTKDSITIQWKDWKPRTFPVNDVLARGDFQMYPRIGARKYQPSASEMYPLTAVMVGDCVNIKYAQIDGKVICDHINISKRPGGKVPPLPKEAEDLMRTTAYTYIPYHERMQAHLDLVERGIPYPAHFPYRRFPIAPFPREVKRDTGGVTRP